MFCEFTIIHILFSGSSSGLDIGLTVGLLFLLIFIGVSTCIGLIVCYKKKRSRQIHAAATTPATRATIVTPNQTISMTNPNLYVQSQHSQQPQPPVLYTQPQYRQQPVYKDAHDQLSFQEPPPSYDAVTAAANPTQEIPLVICSLGCM